MFFLSSIAFYLATYSLLPTLPLILRSRGAGPTEIGLVIGAFTATALLLRAPMGKVLARTPAVVLLRRGQAVIVLAFLVNLAPWGVLPLLFGRIIQGLGFAAFNTAAYVYLSEIAGPSRRAEYVSLFGLCANVAMALAPAAGALILAKLGASGLFALGALLAGVGTLIVPTDQTPPLAGGTFQWWEGAVWRPTAAMFGLSLAYGTVMAFVPLAVRGAGLGHGWLFFTTYAGAIIATRLTTRRLIDRGERLHWVFGGIASVFAGVSLLSVSGSWTGFLAAAALFGLGVGCTHPPLMVYVLESVPEERRGGAAAMGTSAFDAGAAVGPALGGWVAGRFSYGASFAVSAGLLAALLLPLWLGYRTDARKPRTR